MLHQRAPKRTQGVRALHVLVAVRDRDEQAARGEPMGEKFQQIHRRRACPMEVFENQQQRALAP